jgi:PEGA domain
MDFLDPVKTRRNTIQLFIGYGLVAIAVLLATLIMISYAYGYAVDREGDLRQRGLVFVSSQPSGAQLYVNGKREQDTNTKLNLNEGSYSLKIERSGYQSWQRNVTIDGSSVSHYVYPLLVPTRLTTRQVKTYETAPVLTTQSPDRRFLVALTDPVKGTFDVVDQNKNQDAISETDSFAVPEALMTASSTTPTWEVLEWSNNNRHMLLKRTYTEADIVTLEYLLVDRQRPEGSHNLSTELTDAPELISLRDKKPDSYYVFNPSKSQLLTASLDNLTPKVLLNNVLAYKSHGKDEVLYVAKNANDDKKVQVLLRQDGKTTLLRSTVPSDKYTLDIARYSDDWYAVFGGSNETRAYMYKNPTAKAVNDVAKPFYALRVASPTHVSFSANAQYIMAQNATTVHMYDTEYNRNYRYDLPAPVDPPQTKVAWMDGNRLSYVSGGKQIMFDYDNINRRTLVAASPEFVSGFDQEYRYLYTYTSDNKGGLTLSVTPLRNTADL